MKIEKEDLKLFVGIDTFELRADIDLKVDSEGIRPCGVLNKCTSHGRLWRYKITCGKIKDGYKMSDFYAVIEFVKDMFSNATVLYINRLDIKFDNVMLNSYEKYYKLNSALLALIADKYNLSNRYSSLDPFTGTKETIRVERKTFAAAEYYNKQVQKSDLLIGSRLEFRSLNLADKNRKGLKEINLLNPLKGVISEYVAEWFEMMLAAANKEIFESVKYQVNKSIINNYDEGKFASVAEYVAYNSDRIYDAKQVRTIYESFKKSGRNGDNFFVQRPLQQSISVDDIKAYIEILREVTKKWLENE